jgi:hypothetical protein
MCHTYYPNEINSRKWWKYYLITHLLRTQIRFWSWFPRKIHEILILFKTNPSFWVNMLKREWLMRSQVLYFSRNRNHGKHFFPIEFDHIRFPILHSERQFISITRKLPRSKCSKKNRKHVCCDTALLWMIVNLDGVAVMDAVQRLMCGSVRVPFNLCLWAKRVHGFWLKR